MSAHITLTVANPGQLMQGCTVSHRFDWRGGTVGRQQCDWQLFDRAQGIHPLHCEVRWREGTFCVMDRCGQTFVNDHQASLPPGLWVRLGALDSLRIGEYRIRLQLHDSHSSDEHSLNQLLDHQRCPLRALGRPLEPVTPPTEDWVARFDPLAALDANKRHARRPCSISDLLDSRRLFVEETR